MISSPADAEEKQAPVLLPVPWAPNSEPQDDPVFSEPTASLNGRSREIPWQSAAREGEGFSDYDTSQVQSDYVGVSTSEAAAKV